VQVASEDVLVYIVNDMTGAAVWWGSRQLLILPAVFEALGHASVAGRATRRGVGQDRTWATTSEEFWPSLQCLPPLNPGTDVGAAREPAHGEASE